MDARPLAHLRTGIGQYTLNVLKQLTVREDISLYLYGIENCESLPSVHFKTSVITRLLSSSLAAQLNFPRWAKGDAVDLFWSPRHHLPLSWNKPSVVTIHDFVWQRYPASMKTGGRFLESILMPRSVRAATKIICVSNSTKQDLLEYFPEVEPKVTVILEAPCIKPTGLEQCPHPRPYILFVGTHEPRKNLERLLLAWKKSKLFEHGFDLILAGGKGWKYSAKNSIRDNQLEKSVFCLSPDAQQLQDLYAFCYALAMPSLYEGFGLPLVEAMAFGKPLITSPVSAMLEIADKAAVFAEPGSVDQISSALQRLAKDKTLYEQLATAAKEQSSLYSWAIAAEKTVQVFSSALSNS
ncbi:MAG: glycosyltransferase family 4 protein [bacterium]